MPKTVSSDTVGVSFETVGVSFETVGVSFETVGTIMKQGDYREKSHKKCPEEHRAFWKVFGAYHITGCHHRSCGHRLRFAIQFPLPICALIATAFTASMPRRSSSCFKYKLRGETFSPCDSQYPSSRLYQPSRFSPMQPMA